MKKMTEQDASDAIDGICDQFSPDAALSILGDNITSQIERASNGNADRALLKFGAVVATMGDCLAGIIQEMRLITPKGDAAE